MTKPSRWWPWSRWLPGWAASSWAGTFARWSRDDGPDDDGLDDGPFGAVSCASLRGANQKQQQRKRRWSEHDQLRRPLSLSLSAILRTLTNTLTVCHMTRTNWSLSTAKPNICHDVFSKSMFNIRHMMHQGVWEPYLVCRWRFATASASFCAQKPPRPMKVPGAGPQGGTHVSPPTVTAQLGTKSGNGGSGGVQPVAMRWAIRNITLP